MINDTTGFVPTIELSLFFQFVMNLSYLLTFNGCQSLHFQKRRPATAKHSISVHPALISHYKHHQNITMPPTEDKRKAARETIDILYEISSLLVSSMNSYDHCLSTRRRSTAPCTFSESNIINPLETLLGLSIYLKIMLMFR